MTNSDKIQKAITSRFPSGTELTTAEIVAAVLEQFPEVPKGSILPGDYCDNHQNKDPQSGRVHIFSRVSRGKYRVL